MRTALFPGSFDPFTAGHEAIVRRALALFDKIYIAVGVNTDKKYMFSIEERLKIIRNFFPDDKRIETVSYSGMTVDLCHQLNTRFIIRGIRNAADHCCRKPNPRPPNRNHPPACRQPTPRHQQHTHSRAIVTPIKLTQLSIRKSYTSKVSVHRKPTF